MTYRRALYSFSHFLNILLLFREYVHQFSKNFPKFDDSQVMGTHNLNMLHSFIDNQQ
jgi:hypothetical protein